MRLFTVKNDNGEYAHIDMDELTWETGFATLWFGVNEPYAKRTASDYGGHVVELTEKPVPKRYVLPMPGTDYHNIQMHGSAQYYAIKGTENWRPDAIALGTDDAVKHGYTVTQTEIDAAPAWVKAITPVEVTDDEG